MMGTPGDESPCNLAVTGQPHAEEHDNLTCLLHLVAIVTLGHPEPTGSSRIEVE